MGLRFGLGEDIFDEFVLVVEPPALIARLRSHPKLPELHHRHPRPPGPQFHNVAGLEFSAIRTLLFRSLVERSERVGHDRARPRLRAVSLGSPNTGAASTSDELGRHWGAGLLGRDSPMVRLRRLETMAPGAGPHYRFYVTGGIATTLGRTRAHVRGGSEDPRPQCQRLACVAGSSEAGLLVRLSRLLVEDGPAKRRALSRATGGPTVARV